MPKNPGDEPKTEQKIINFLVRKFADRFKINNTEMDLVKRGSLKKIVGTIAAPILPRSETVGVGKSLAEGVGKVVTAAPMGKALVGKLFKGFLEKFNNAVHAAEELDKYFPNKDCAPFSIESILHDGKISVWDSYPVIDLPDELTLDVVSDPEILTEVWKKGRILYGDEYSYNFDPKNLKEHLEFLRKITGSEKTDTLGKIKARFTAGMRTLAEKITAAPDEIFDGEKSRQLKGVIENLKACGVPDTDPIYSSIREEIDNAKIRARVLSQVENQKRAEKRWHRDGLERVERQRAKLTRREAGLKQQKPIECIIYERAEADNPDSFGIFLNTKSHKDWKERNPDVKHLKLVHIMHLYQTCLNYKFSNRDFFSDVDVKEIHSKKVDSEGVKDIDPILVIKTSNKEFKDYLKAAVKNGGELKIPNRVQYENMHDPDFYELGDRGTMEESQEEIRERILGRKVAINTSLPPENLPTK